MYLMNVDRLWLSTLFGTSMRQREERCLSCIFIWKQSSDWYLHIQHVWLCDEARYQH